MLYPLARPLLFALDAESAHEWALSSLDLASHLGLRPLLARKPKPLLTKVFGLEFSNPVGLAAGLDKNGEHIDTLGGLGFGFVEVGTVTPRAQIGNPKPRLFRLAAQQAIINRMGFNNHGVDALARNLERRKYKGIVGVNMNDQLPEPSVDAVPMSKMLRSGASTSQSTSPPWQVEPLSLTLATVTALPTSTGLGVADMLPIVSSPAETAVGTSRAAPAAAATSRGLRFIRGPLIRSLSVGRWRSVRVSR